MGSSLIRPRGVLADAALFAAVAVSAASCHQRPAASPDQGAVPAPVETPDAAAVLRRSAEAMARLTSFEAHRVAVERQWDGTCYVVFTDYRFEPPDRHSYVTRSRAIAPDGRIDPGERTDGGEARQIGSSYWSRASVRDAAAPWTCTIDSTRPDPMSYAPPSDAVLMGEERSSLGFWYRFRSEPKGMEWWIAPSTYRVTRIEYAGEHGDTAATVSEIATYYLDEFDSPTQIVAPGPCTAATATGEPVP